MNELKLAGEDIEFRWSSNRAWLEFEKYGSRRAIILEKDGTWCIGYYGHEHSTRMDSPEDCIDVINAWKRGEEAAYRTKEERDREKHFARITKIKKLMQVNPGAASLIATLPIEHRNRAIDEVDDSILDT